MKAGPDVIYEVKILVWRKLTQNLSRKFFDRCTIGQSMNLNQRFKVEKIVGEEKKDCLEKEKKMNRIARF